MKTGDSSEQCDFCLIAEVIIHIGAFFSVFVRVVPLAFACDKARKMPEYKFDSLGVKFFGFLDNGERD